MCGSHHDGSDGSSRARAVARGIADDFPPCRRRRHSSTRMRSYRVRMTRVAAFDWRPGGALPRDVTPTPFDAYVYLSGAPRRLKVEVIDDPPRATAPRSRGPSEPSWWCPTRPSRPTSTRSVPQPVPLNPCRMQSHLVFNGRKGGRGAALIRSPRRSDHGCTDAKPSTRPRRRRATVPDACSFLAGRAALERKWLVIPPDSTTSSLASTGHGPRPMERVSSRRRLASRRDGPAEPETAWRLCRRASSESAERRTRRTPPAPRLVQRGRVGLRQVANVAAATVPHAESRAPERARERRDQAARAGRSGEPHAGS